MPIIGNPWAQDATRFAQGVGDSLTQGMMQLPQQRYMMALQQAQMQQQQAQEQQQDMSPKPQAKGLKDTNVTLSVADLLDLHSGGKATQSYLKTESMKVKHQFEHQKMMREEQRKEQEAKQKEQQQQAMQQQQQQGMMGQGGIYGGGGMGGQPGQGQPQQPQQPGM